MAYKGILELTGVWPSAVAGATQAGFRGVSDLSGAILTGGGDGVTQAGWIGVSQLNGVWLSGGYEAEILETPGYYGVDGIAGKRKKEDDEIIALIMAMYESGTFH